MRTSSVRHLLPLCALLCLSGCDDHTVLTGPDAVAAAERIRAGGSLAAESSADDDENRPLIILDGERQISAETAHALLRRISPDDIDRIEVLMGCPGYAVYGDKGRRGVLLIFTKGFDRSQWQLPEPSAERREECRLELERDRGR